MVNDNLKNNDELIKKLRETKTVVTHFGDDLDNRSSIYVLEKWAKEQGILKEDEQIIVERVPAGKVKDGYVNLDTGGHTGCREENGTIVIDGNPKEGVKSAIQALKDRLDVEVPEQILEIADAMPNKISPLDTRSGLSLQKYTDIKEVFKMAEEGLLDKELTDEQLEKYGLVEAQKTQQRIVDEAIEKINKYTVELANKEKVVISPEFIKAGSAVAYELGINYFASVDMHKSGEGVTFAINSKPGVTLPENIRDYGKELVEKYKNDDGTSGVFVHPNNSMVVAGGPKNPDFKVEMSKEDMMEQIDTLFKEYAREDIKKQISEQDFKMQDLMKQNIKLDEKENKAKDLKEEANEFSKEKDEKNIGD